MSAVGFVPPAAHVDLPEHPSVIRDGELVIEGEIGASDVFVTAVAVRKARDELLATNDIVRVVIDSNGGAVAESLLVYQAFRECPKPVHVHVENAASAATIIAMAGAEITIAEHGRILVHDPRSWFRMGGWYGSKAMREEADGLDHMKGLGIDIIARRSRIDRAEIDRLMTVEGEFIGQAAVDAGLADRVVPDRQPHICTSCGQALPSKLVAPACAGGS